MKSATFQNFTKPKSLKDYSTLMTDFIITFRETLEAALVVGIVLSYLSRVDKKTWFHVVYWALVSGMFLSVILGFAFEVWLGGFEGVAEEIYEGAIMILAALLISWMILWMGVCCLVQ